MMIKKDLVKRALLAGAFTWTMMGAGDLTPDSWKANAESGKKAHGKKSGKSGCGKGGCGEGGCGEGGCGAKKKKKSGKESGCGEGGRRRLWS